MLLFETFFNFDRLFPRMQLRKSSPTCTDYDTVEAQSVFMMQKSSLFKFTTETPKGPNASVAFSSCTRKMFRILLKKYLKDGNVKDFSAPAVVLILPLMSLGSFVLQV